MGKWRKGIVIVTYSKTEDKIEYLILKRILHWKGWEVPKGGLDKKEDLTKAVKREIKEETGLKVLDIKRFPISGKYKYHKELADREGIVGQTYKLFSAEVKKGKINFKKNHDKEHSDYKWVDYETALKKLTWPNQRKCLRVVNSYLNKAR